MPSSGYVLNRPLHAVQLILKLQFWQVSAATEMTIAKDASLSYDLLLRIFEICKDDYRTLYRCSLVNWDFNRAASRMLYARVVLSPPFRPSLSLRDPDGLSVSISKQGTINYPLTSRWNYLWQDLSQFKSASLPRNADLVLTLEIKGTFQFFIRCHQEYQQLFDSRFPVASAIPFESPVCNASDGHSGIQKPSHNDISTQNLSRGFIY